MAYDERFMKEIQNTLKWSAIGGAVGGATGAGYGLGVDLTLRYLNFFVHNTIPKSPVSLITRYGVSTGVAGATIASLIAGGLSFYSRQCKDAEARLLNIPTPEAEATLVNRMTR